MQRHTLSAASRLLCAAACILIAACGSTSTKTDHQVNAADAAARGIKDGGRVWVTGPENGSKARVKALVTDRVGKGVAFMPFHFSGWFQGVDQRGNYPKGADPIVLGESVNTITSYGYDPVTGMHEGKVTLCQIQSA